MLGVYNLPTAITLSGLALSILACILSFNNYIEFAVVCFIFAGLCDLFDGVVARKVRMTKREKQFGLQIDSIVDVLSFGLAPVIILLHAGFNSVIDYILFIFYCSSAAMRLAVFNQTRQNNENELKTFTGLPVTYAALVFPLVFTLGTFINPGVYNVLIRVTVFILGFFFILKIPIPKPRGIFYIIFPLIALGLTIFWLFRAIL